MAPKAKLNDGLIDLLIIRSHKTFDLLSIFSKVYNGTHTDLDYVEYKQVKWFAIIPFRPDGEVVLDQDQNVDAEEVVDIDGVFSIFFFSFSLFFFPSFSLFVYFTLFYNLRLMDF